MKLFVKVFGFFATNNEQPSENDSQWDVLLSRCLLYGALKFYQLIINIGNKKSETVHAKTAFPQVGPSFIKMSGMMVPAV